MVAVRQKPPSALQNTRGGRGRGVSIGGRPPGWRIPNIPREVTAPLTDAVQRAYQAGAVRHARAAWRSWWASPASLAVDVESDLEALNWWIICVFRRSLYLQLVRDQPLVKGSQKQPVRNPLEDVISAMSREIARVEARFGMTTLDRFRLHFEATGHHVDEDQEERDAEDEYRRLLQG